MIYELEFAESAKRDTAKLKRSEPQAYKKLVILLEELQEHPETGIGHPKPLGKNRPGQWSRKITQKHRLVYQIMKEEITVFVLSTYGHYDDK
jgi:toxin YoeB